MVKYFATGIVVSFKDERICTMITNDLANVYFQALLDKNPEFEGVFYVGATTTGVFCRPTCPARKPKKEHCEFFKTAQEALLASFRPCKRCRPLSHPNQDAFSLKSTWIDTVLGPMVAIADEGALYLLEFVTRRGLEREVERLRKRGFAIVPGSNATLEMIASELAAYFDGNLFQFKTPYRVFGSCFQQQVWEVLCQIPYGETRSYAEQAIVLGKPKAYRAVANANGANQLAIIIPCHRIIASDGTLGGYGGGLSVKQWLLDHEKLNK